MNFSELIKSKFKSGDEITSLLCWMDMIPQILVDLHLEISSLAWKHQISRHAMEDCLWKMVGFPTQSWILEYVVGLYMEKYAHNLHSMDKRIIMVTIEWKKESYSVLGRGWEGKLNEFLSLPRVPGSYFSSCLPLRVSLGSLASTKTVSNSPTDFRQKKVNKKMTGMLRTIFELIL